MNMVLLVCHADFPTDMRTERKENIAGWQNSRSVLLPTSMDYLIFGFVSFFSFKYIC